MRRVHALTAAVVLTAIPAFAGVQSGSSSAALQVSVQVVRPCTVSTGGGQPAVTCGGSGAARSSTPTGASPAPQASPTTQTTSADAKVVTINF